MTRRSHARSAAPPAADPTQAAKERYYSQDDVVAGYDRWRFGSAGGRYVDGVELSTVLRLLRDVPRDARVLDMPCGTGRLARALVDDGRAHVTGADRSPAMLSASRAALPGVELREEDAFATSFAAGSVDALVSLRFLFHTPAPERLFAEWARIVAPRGVVVFDSLRWTPRGWLPLVDRALGGRLWPHGEQKIERLMAAHGFVLEEKERVLALPSLAYRFLPSALVAPLARLERAMPRTLWTKTFFRFRRAPTPAHGSPPGR